MDSRISPARWAVSCRMSTPSDKYEQGNLCLAAGRLAEAQRLYREVVGSNPRHAQAWHQLGCVAVQQRRPEAATDCFIRAIRLEGGQAAFHNNLGNCYRLLGQLTEAEASFKQAIRLQGDHVAALMNLSFTLYSQGRTSEAERCADAALRLPHSTAEEHCVCGALRLLRGDYEGGWPQHEWRLALPGSPWQSLPGRKWDGQPLDGQTVLLHAEGGLGDTLQFLRYVPAVVERGGRPILWVPGSLIPLLRESGLREIAPLEEPTPPCDFHRGLVSLPNVFRTTLATIPNRVPYVYANPQLTAQWRERLSGMSGFRVGICWQGNPAYSRDRMRSIPLRAFGALARIPGVRLISLQKCAGLEQLPEVSGEFEVLELGPDYDAESGAFMNGAAIMRNLDLVIAPDTAIAHLAGALGVAVWVALSVEPDWRWMLDRSDSPWYPTMRLFRQRRAGDWEELFGRMAEALSVEVVARGSAPLRN